MVATVAILVVPVSLQIISRYTQLIPSYIWTEELSRFLFIWMVMLGAMVGIKEGTHFEVDIWPELSRRANAMLRIISNLFVLIFALVFVYWGIKFVEFGWYQESELAELPMGRPMTQAAMSPGTAALVLFGSFFILIALRVPVAFALGLACLPPLLFELRLSPMVLFNETFKSYNSFILLAVPFFLLTANLMNIGGITDRLVHLSRTMVGNWPGSLAQINVLLSVFFAGISGSSTADAASQSKIFIEAQTKEGYDLSFSIAITAVSAVLAVIIPPSILMIVWGGVLSVSIGALYLAGILPGLLIAGAQMATVHVYAKIYNYPVYPRATLREFFCSAAQSVPALMT
ncbi:MAG: TRAP transporter large permease subunit, partial [Alphaproteobacteria bacterium]